MTTQRGHAAAGVFHNAEYAGLHAILSHACEDDKDLFEHIFELTKKEITELSTKTRELRLHPQGAERY